jgi:hypothetical protein
VLSSSVLMVTESKFFKVIRQETRGRGQEARFKQQDRTRTLTLYPVP